MILVVAEQRDGALNRASWEAIAAAQQMAGAWPITVLALGASVGDVANELAQADVAEVLTGEHAGARAVHARRVHDGAEGRHRSERRRPSC